MANLTEIKNWFKTGLKPTQTQFWATWDSFWHKDTPIPQNAVEDLENTLTNKADTALLEEHINDHNAHAGGDSGRRFGIEDKTSEVDRQVSMNGHDIIFTSTGTFEVSGSLQLEYVIDNGNGDGGIWFYYDGENELGYDSLAGKSIIEFSDTFGNLGQVPNLPNNQLTLHVHYPGGETNNVVLQGAYNDDYGWYLYTIDQLPAGTVMLGYSISVKTYPAVKLDIEQKKYNNKKELLYIDSEEGTVKKDIISAQDVFKNDPYVYIESNNEIGDVIINLSTENTDTDGSAGIQMNSEGDISAVGTRNVQIVGDSASLTGTQAVGMIANSGYALIHAATDLIVSANSMNINTADNAPIVNGNPMILTINGQQANAAGNIEVAGGGEGGGVPTLDDIFNQAGSEGTITPSSPSGARLGIVVQDNGSALNQFYMLPNQTEFDSSGVFRVYARNGISMTANYGDTVPTVYTGNSGDSNIALSVNGNYADTNGNITVNGLGEVPTLATVISQQPLTEFGGTVLDFSNAGGSGTFKLSKDGTQNDGSHTGNAYLTATSYNGSTGVQPETYIYANIKDNDTGNTISSSYMGVTSTRVPNGTPEGYQRILSASMGFQDNLDGKGQYISANWTSDYDYNNGISVTDSKTEAGLVYSTNYTTNQLANDRAITDVGGVKQLIEQFAGGSSNITPNLHQVLNAGSNGMLVDNGTGYSEEITMSVSSSDYADFSNMKIGVSGSYMSSMQDFSSKGNLLGTFYDGIKAVVGPAERITLNENETRFSFIPMTYSNESVLRASMTTPSHVPSIGKVEEMIAKNISNLQSTLDFSREVNITTTDAENKHFFVNNTNTDTGYFYRLWVGKDQASIIGRSGSTGFYAGETTATMACNDCPAYIIGQTGVNIQSNGGNVSLQGNAVLANGNNVVTSVTNGTSRVYADADGVVDISAISGAGSSNVIPTLQQVVEAGTTGIAPFVDGEMGLRLGQSNSEGELQGIVCYPSNVNIQSSHVSLLATERLYAEAQTGYTLTTFNGDIIFNVPSGKFIVNENSVLTGNYGTATINPSTGTTFTIPHNFYNIYGNPVPSYMNVSFSKNTPDLMYYTTTIDDTYITVTFPTVPTETSLDIYWEVRP